MPIFEYKCNNCNFEFEFLLILASDKPECPECGKTNIKKLLSTSNFTLKGDGWAKDNYGKPKPKPIKKSDVVKKEKE